MKKPVILLSCLSLLLSLLSCETKKSVTHQYYPIDSLIENQIEFLLESKAQLTKKAEINGAEETSTFAPKDSAAWAYELDIFAELNSINNPVKVGNYKVESGLKDSTSNLSIHLISAQSALPVVFVKIFYLESLSKIRRVEALYREENSLLKGTRLLILEFQEINNKTALVSYSIEGSQQMFLGDAVQFVIRGTIAIQ
ncbi:MAG TPA: hypothetical protein VFU05_20545 [Cyclobacteriaceae bacterium]|nr:hypothetical protein [Cyclobacteriaceae bacterium]